MPFYIGDWKKDPAIQVLTREEKMIWLDMIFLMWESEERGFLTINKKPIQIQALCQAMILDNQRLTSCLTYFENLNLFSRRENDGAIFSRKILRIVEISEKRQNAGIKGGNPLLKKNSLTKRLTKNKPKGYPNTENEIENEIEIKIKNKEKNPEIIFPFNSPQFNQIWAAWVKYRQEIKKPYKSILSIQGVLKKLSEYPEEIAIKMIEQSIANQWQGIFEIKTNNLTNGNKQDQRRAGLQELARQSAGTFFNSSGESI